MFLALVGDSTMTSDVPPAGAGSLSSNDSTTADLRAVAFFTAFFAAFFAGAFLAADLAGAFTTVLAAAFAAGVADDFADAEVPALAAVLGAAFLVGICSVYQGTVATHGAIIKAHVFRDRADVREADAAIHMDERTLHELLKIVRMNGPGGMHRHQIAPRVGGESPAFVWALYPDGGRPIPRRRNAVTAPTGAGFSIAIQ